MTFICYLLFLLTNQDVCQSRNSVFPLISPHGAFFNFEALSCGSNLRFILNFRAIEPACYEKSLIKIFFHQRHFRAHSSRPSVRHSDLLYVISGFYIIKEAYRKKASWSKTLTLTKSMNTDIWLVHQINSICEVLKMK